MKKRMYLDLIYNPNSFSTFNRECAPLFQRSRKPFEKLASCFNELIDEFSFEKTHVDILASKIENACRKILMMSKASKKAIDCEAEIMVGQYRGTPVLMWDDEIELLYHLEAMILFGRSALDISAYVFSSFLLRKRTDSFNKFCKSLKKASDSNLSDLKEEIESKESVETSWLNILRSSEKGRSVRDKVAHQTIAKIEYRKVRPTSEKEYCHVVVKDKAIPLERFVEEVTESVTDFCLLAEDIILSTCASCSEEQR